MAPAKLNLFLHVIGRRADGYHLLQSVFQLIDRGDTLDFQVRDDGKICRTSTLAGVPAESDLTVRAARLLQATTGTHYGADIAIDKKLPMGGGLGGGSSDAATTLLALNTLWKTGVSRADLMQLGAQLGADVPFFLFGRNAFVEGIGEQLTPITTPPQWFVVIEPGVQIPTPVIFSEKDLTRDTKPVKILDFSNRVENFGKNDLQSVAVKLFPEVGEAIASLMQYGAAKMTGSGACVFCAFSSESQADVAVNALSNRWKVWKTRGLAAHPLASQ